MDWELKGKKGFEDFSGGKWKFQKDSLQGVSVDILKQVFKSGNEKDIYKLVLKNEWTSDEKIDFEGKGVRGALSLIKATWKKDGEKWEAVDVKVGDNTKVWLIMAQGQNSIYLMPVVRNAKWWGKDSYWSVSARGETAKGEVEKNGITDISKWGFDKVKEWKDNQDKRIQNAMKDGFSITRKVGGAVLSWTENEGEKRIFVKEFSSLSDHESRGGKSEYLYKNAGVLGFNEQARDLRKCNEIEHYFPLDLVWS